MVIFIAVFGMGGVSQFFLDGIAELRRSNDIYNTQQCIDKLKEKIVQIFDYQLIML